MNKHLILFVTTSILIMTLAHAANPSLGYSNDNAPVINARPPPASITNVTFNQSLIDSLYLRLSGSNANQNINIGQWNLSGGTFKGLFNWTSGDTFTSFNGASLTLTSLVTQWLYNQTTPAISYTNTIFAGNSSLFNYTYNATYANLIGQNCAGGLLVNGTLTNGSLQCTSVSIAAASFNATYNNLLNQTCPGGQVVNGTLVNGTLVCVTPTAAGDGSFNATYASFAYNQTTPAISYTNTIFAGNSSLFNYTYNSTYAPFAYNQTLMSNIFNQTLNTTSNVTFKNITVTDDIVINGVRVSPWLYNQTYGGSTFNATYNNLILQQCPGGQVVNGTLTNGTLVCVTPTAAGDGSFNSTYASFAYNQTTPAISYTNTIFAGNSSLFNYTYNATYATFAYNQTLMSNIFNQILNTTSNVTFKNITVTDDIVVGGLRVTPWLYNQSDGSYNATQANQLNQSCAAGQFVNGTVINGTLLCGSPAASTNSFNATYNNLIGQMCGGGLIVNGTLSNGTLICIPDGGFNTTYNSFSYNQTTVAITYTNTIFAGNSSYFNITFNATYNNILAQNCIGGQFVNGTLSNGSLNCGAVTVTSTFNSTYNNLLTQMCPGGQFHNGTLANGTFICQPVSTFNTTYATPSTFNATYDNQVLEQCPGGQFVNGSLTNGTFVCAASAASGGGEISNASLNLLYLNLSGTNARQNINISNATTGLNVTAQAFIGFLNWSWLTNIPGFLTYNSSVPDNAYVTTIFNGNSSYFNNTFNASYNNQNLQQCVGGQVVNGTLSNGTFVCVTPTAVGDGSFNSTYAQFAYNQTLMSNIFNQTLNTTSNVTFKNITVTDDIVINSVRVSPWLYNQTTPAISYVNTIWAGNNSLLNATFNSTYGNLLGQNCVGGQFVNGTLTNGSLNCGTVGAIGDGSFNSTYASFAYNQTTPAISYTNTIFAGNSSLFNYTYNATYATYAYNQSDGSFNQTQANQLSQMCPVNTIVNGTLVNGTFVCTTDQTSAGGSFLTDQGRNNLNVTANVTFANLNLSGGEIHNVSYIMGHGQNSTFNYFQGGLVLTGGYFNSSFGGVTNPTSPLARGNIILAVNESSQIVLNPGTRGSTVIGGNDLIINPWMGTAQVYGTWHFMGGTAVTTQASHTYGSSAIVYVDGLSSWTMNNQVNFLGGFNTSFIQDTNNNPATFTPGAGAGASPTDASTGTMLAGIIDITTDLFPTVDGVIITVGYPSDCNVDSSVQLTPANAASSTVPGLLKGGIYVTSDKDSFDINDASVALLGSTQYKWYYQVTCR